MTTEEKRKALVEFCDGHSLSDCAQGCCPLDYRKDCGFTDMCEAEVDEAYSHAFPETEEKHSFQGAMKKLQECGIKDSGERREFDTGAVRDIQEGKGRCDLMPLDVVGAYLYEDTIRFISEFQRTGDVVHLYGAINASEIKGDPYHIVLEVAKHFEEGAKKYGEHNWQKGIPTHCYIDSAVRHYLKWLRGDKDEPHDRAFVWNILCCIWTCIHKPELNDYGKGGETDA